MDNVVDMPLGRVAPAGQNVPMRSSTILLPLLIITSLAVDLALVGSLAAEAKWPALSVAVVLGLAAGQINLVTLWGVLGSGHLPWRITALLVVPIGWGFALAASAPNIKSGYDVVAKWEVHFLTQTVLLASILVLIRLSGAVLRLGDLATDLPLRRMQFTLRYLFAWLTSTAISLSVLKTTFDHARLKETDFEWDRIVILGLVGGMIGLAAVWLILDTRDRSRKLAATFVTALPVVTVVGAMVFLVANERQLVAVFQLWSVAGLYSAIAWVVLRVAGIRLVWLRSNKAPS